MTTSIDLDRWLLGLSGSQRPWFAKRLSANDTTATGGHQYGFHLPNILAFRVFPEVREGINPRIPIRFIVVSHDTRCASVGCSR